MSQAKKANLKNQNNEQTTNSADTMWDFGLDLTNKLPRVLYFWQAPERIPYKSPVSLKGFLAFLTLVFALYFWWVGQILMTLAVMAFFYLYYLIITVPPIKVEHVIYSNGIKSLGHFYPWENLVNFWVGFKDGWYVVYITTNLRMPKMLIMLVEDKKQLKDILLILGQFIPYKPLIKKPSFWEKNAYGIYVPVEELVDTQDLMYNLDKLKLHLKKVIQNSAIMYKKKHNLNKVQQ